MSDTVIIPIGEATNAQLLYYATAVLGLDVKPGANSTTFRAKIEAAAPGTTEISVPAKLAGVPEVSAPDAPVAEQEAIPNSREGLHFKYDPKVLVEVHETADKTRSREVQIAVNGDVVILQRGKKQPIPYRHYLALRDAVETIGRETDEINKVTGLPIIEFVDQPSYSHSAILPAQELIDAWHTRVDAPEIA